MTKKKLLIPAVIVLLLVLLVVYMAPFRIRLSGDVYSLTENHAAGQWELDLLHVRIPLLGHKIFGEPQFPEGCTPVKQQGGSYCHCASPASNTANIHMLNIPFYRETDNAIHWLDCIYCPALNALTLYDTVSRNEYVFPASTSAEAQALLTAMDEEMTLE